MVRMAGRWITSVAAARGTHVLCLCGAVLLAWSLKAAPIHASDQTTENYPNGLCRITAVQLNFERQDYQEEKCRVDLDKVRNIIIKEKKTLGINIVKNSNVVVTLSVYTTSNSNICSSEISLTVRRRDENFRNFNMSYNFEDSFDDKYQLFWSKSYMLIGPYEVHGRHLRRVAEQLLKNFSETLFSLNENMICPDNPQPLAATSQRIESNFCVV